MTRTRFSKPTQKVREATITAYDDVLKNRVTDPKTSCEVIVMQRVHEGDLSGDLLANDASVTAVSRQGTFAIGGIAALPHLWPSTVPRSPPDLRAEPRPVDESQRRIHRSPLRRAP
jgi:hypothetical protein